MAPKKAVGGAGQKSAQNYVTKLWQRGLSEEDIRKQLKDRGYKLGRISQLIGTTRPREVQEGIVAASAAAASGSRDRPTDSDQEASRFFHKQFFTGDVYEISDKVACVLHG